MSDCTKRHLRTDSFELAPPCATSPTSTAVRQHSAARSVCMYVYIYIYILVDLVEFNMGENVVLKWRKESPSQTNSYSVWVVAGDYKYVWVVNHQPSPKGFIESLKEVQVWL